MAHMDWFAQLCRCRVSLILLVSSWSLFDKLRRCLLRTIHCKMQTKRCVMSLKQDFTTCSSGIVFLMVFLLAFMTLQVITSCHVFKNRWFVTLPFDVCLIPHSFLHSGGFCLIRQDHGLHVTNSSLVTSNTKATFHRSPLHFPQPKIRQSSIHSALKRTDFCRTAIRNSILKNQSSCSHLD